MIKELLDGTGSKTLMFDATICSHNIFDNTVSAMVVQMYSALGIQSSYVYTKITVKSLALRSGSTVTNEVNPRCGYC